MPIIFRGLWRSVWRQVYVCPWYSVSLLALTVILYTCVDEAAWLGSKHPLTNFAFVVGYLPIADSHVDAQFLVSTHSICAEAAAQAQPQTILQTTWHQRQSMSYCLWLHSSCVVHSFVSPTSSDWTWSWSGPWIPRFPILSHWLITRSVLHANLMHNDDDDAYALAWKKSTSPHVCWNRDDSKEMKKELLRNCYDSSISNTPLCSVLVTDHTSWDAH